MGDERSVEELEKLAARARELTMIFDHSAVGMARAAKSGELTAVNASFARILGYGPEELVGRSFLHVTHPEDREASVAQVRRLQAREAQAISFEKRYVRKDGSVIWGNVTVSVARDERDEFEAAIVTLEDITGRVVAQEEKREVETQLQQAMKMEAIGRLAGGIAHDFNNLLTAIGGHVQLALMDLPEGSPVRSAMVEVSLAAQRATDLTRQLLAFSRKQIIAPRPIDLNEVVERLRPMLERVIGEDITLVWAPRQPLPPVEADPGQVEQMLLNIVVNARDAVPDGGTIRIETDALVLDEERCRPHATLSPGDHVVLAVHDDGTGMDEEVRSRVFEPFFTTKPRGKGTGLGLPTVFGAMVQHRGAVEVDSTPGAGTTVRLVFPRALGEHVPLALAERLADVPGGDETVLLVEDEPTVRTMVARMLARLGYVVIEAANGDAALLEAEGFGAEIHLLLTDIVMPGMNGRELADRIRSTRADLRVLYMSGYSEEVVARQGILEPGLHFISKPFGADALAVKLREVLAAPP